MALYEDIVGIGTSVEARLGTELDGTGVLVSLGYVSQGKEWDLTTSGEIVPAAIVEAPGVAKTGRQGQAMTGAANSLSRARFGVLCVGPTALSCIKVLGLVCDALVGFKPVSGGGEIELIGSAMLEPTQQTGAPTRYAMPVGFSLSIGANVVS